VCVCVCVCVCGVHDSVGLEHSWDGYLLRTFCY
jgi:hypothetical protein